MYINQKYFNSIDWLMLEIKLPREIFKSPLATEIAVSTFLQSSGASTAYARNYEGKLPFFGSLEIASIEGVIHFYIRVQSRFRTLMESNFYAQYPGIEIVEAEDYTKLIHFHHLDKSVKLVGMNYRVNAKWKPTDEQTGKPYKDSEKKGDDYEMKADFLPLKTYVDYELDKNPKEEFKVDPLTPLLEAMGACGKGEHMWYQLILQDESVYNDKKMPKFYVNQGSHKHMNLKEMADARKKQIRTAGWNIKDEVVADAFGVPTKIEEYNDKYEQQFDVQTDKDGKEIKIPRKILARHRETKAVGKKEIELTAEEKDEIDLINKKMSKPLAVCVARAIYVAKAENFKGGQFSSLLNFTKGFAGANKLGAVKITDPYDYPWERHKDERRVWWRSEETFESYVEREGFYPHIPERKSFDEWEDRFFWTFSMKQRKLFRMIFEAVFHPFSHPEASEAFILNLEEVATLWHLPGAVAGTPTLPRIDSNKGVAPTNLPI